jgi:hypothetical protein
MICERRGQPLVHVRHGVRLTALKARIFDAIERAGAIGIATRDLFDLVFANDPRPSFHLHAEGARLANQPTTRRHRPAHLRPAIDAAPYQQFPPQRDTAPSGESRHSTVKRVAHEQINS